MRVIGEVKRSDIGEVRRKLLRKPVLFSAASLLFWSVLNAVLLYFSVTLLSDVAVQLHGHFWLAWAEQRGIVLRMAALAVGLVALHAFILVFMVKNLRWTWRLIRETQTRIDEDDGWYEPGVHYGRTRVEADEGGLSLSRANYFIRFDWSLITGFDVENGVARIHLGAAGPMLVARLAPGDLAALQGEIDARAA